MTKIKTFELPYIGIDTEKYGVIYNDCGDQSVIIQFDNPIEQFCADYNRYQSFHQLFDNILKILGPNYTLQKQDIFIRKSYKSASHEDFLNNQYFHHFDGRSFVDIKSYLIITRNVKRNLFFNYDEKQQGEFNNKVEKILALLLRHNANPRILFEKDIKLYVKRIIAFNFRDDHFFLDNIKSNDHGISIGSSKVKSISLVDVDEINLPGVVKPYIDHKKFGYAYPMDFMGFLHEVPDFETIIYNQIIAIPAQNTELTRLESKKRRHEAIPDPANKVAVKDIDNLLHDVARDNQLLVYGHFNIMIQAQEAHFNQTTNYIESALFSLGITPSKNAYNQLELYRSSLPGNASELKPYDKFLTTGDAAICFLFKEKKQTSEKSGFQLYLSDRKGIPIAIDTQFKPMVENRINNRNMFVLGPSGSGKSFFMNHIVRQYFQQDMDVVLIDTGHSYSGLCQYYQGRYITYSDEAPITMNPFLFSEKEFNEEKKEFLKSIIGVAWKGVDGTLNQIEDSVLSNVIQAYYSDYFSGNSFNPQLSFNTFYVFSSKRIASLIEKEKIDFDLQSYRFVLKKFCVGGEYETILNNELDKGLFDEKFIVFEIDAIKEHKILFPITTLIIMDVFLQKMRLKKNRKALIIEEAWKAIASPMMAGYILYLYKTVRKFNGFATVVTQELDDILNNPIVKDSIISNSDTIALLDQTKFRDNYDQVARLLSINDVERRKIFTINNMDNKDGRTRFKEVYIKRGNRGEVYGVEVSLYEYLTYTTERTEKEAVEYYIKRFKDYESGLTAFVEDLENSGLDLHTFCSHITKLQHYYENK
jgi:conjugation system TraG family ATPase